MMEVDGGRLTDDERMEEDLSLGTRDGDGDGEDEVMMAEEGEGEGVVEVDGDGDIDLDEGEEGEEYYEEYQEDEDEVIPTIEGEPEAEEIPNPVIPTGGPLVSPFPTLPSENIPIFTRSDSSTSIIFPPPPSLARTQPTPVQETETMTDNIDAESSVDPLLVTEEGNADTVITNDSVIGETLQSDSPFIAPTTTSHPHPQQVVNVSPGVIDSSSSLPIHISTANQNQIDKQDEAMSIPLLPTVPEPAKPVQPDSEADHITTGKEVATEAAEADSSGSNGAEVYADADAAELGDEEEYFDEDDLEAEADIEIEDYPIDSASLPTIILNLPSLGARSLFTPLEDEVKLPVWLKDRQDELAESSLADVWSAIRAECVKEGLNQAGNSGSGGGALVIEEKQTDLRMNEDDVNLQSITLLEFLQLYLDCGLAPPIQLHLSWEPRFITRFNLIQNELDAVKRRRSESANVEPEPEPEPVESYSRPVAQDVGAEAKKVGAEVQGKEDEGEQYDEEDYDELDQVEGEGEGISVKGEDTFSQYGEEAPVQHEQTPEPTYNQEVPEHQQRDDRAQYAESNDVKDTKDLERDHPNWAAIQKQPTEPLHYPGETRRREIRYSKPEPERESELPVTADDVIGEKSTAEAEEEYDDEEERNDDDASWMNDGDADTIESTDVNHSTRSDMDSSAIDQVPLDEVAKLKLQRLQEGSLRRVDSDQEQGKKMVESVEPTAIETATVNDGALTGVEGTEYPLEKVALKTDKDTQIDNGISTQTTDVGSTFPASGLATPVETMSTLSTEGAEKAKAMARNILADEPIPEEEEGSLDVEDATQLVNDRAEVEREREELAPPIEEETTGIVPPTAEEYYDDEYEPDTHPGTPAEHEEIPTSLESDDEQTLPADDIDYDEEEEEDPSTVPTVESEEVDELEPDSIPSATDSSSSKRGYGEDDSGAEAEAEAKRTRID